MIFFKAIVIRINLHHCIQSLLQRQVLYYPVKLNHHTDVCDIIFWMPSRFNGSKLSLIKQTKAISHILFDYGYHTMKDFGHKWGSIVPTGVIKVTRTDKKPPKAIKHVKE